MTTKIAENWVECYGGKSCVVTLGKGVDNSLEHLENSEIIVIIPGNPGLGSMYKDFMSSLYMSLSNPALSIWALSYLGHDSEAPPTLPTDKTYILEDQILHKLALLDKLIPANAKLTLIGHSIGCKVITEVFKRNTTHTIEEIFFLFPTIENMMKTTRGVQTWSLVTTWRPVAVGLVFLLNLLPRSFLTLLTRLRYASASESFIAAAVKFLNPNFLNNVLVMARDELETVLEVDMVTMKAMASKLYLYHGEDDGWSPLEFRDNLLRDVPELEDHARVDSQDIPHAFVEFHGEQVGQIVGDWIKEIRE